MIQITNNEAGSLKEFIEVNFFENIRNDPYIDSMLWAYNILNIYRKCGGFEDYNDAELEEDNNEESN